MCLLVGDAGSCLSVVGKRNTNTNLPDGGGETSCDGTLRSMPFLSTLLWIFELGFSEDSPTTFYQKRERAESCKK